MLNWFYFYLINSFNTPQTFQISFANLENPRIKTKYPRKELSFCHKLWVSYLLSLQLNVVGLGYFKLWILSDQIILISLKYQRYTLSEWLDIDIKY